jgi:signal peptidase
MKIIRKILTVVLNIIIVFVLFVVILVIYNYIQLNFLNKEYTNFFGYTIFEISTNSMSKTLNQYDIVLVKLTKDVNEDDIITYKKDDIITHRIIKIDGEKIVTKGDANNVEDEAITSDNVIGKVVSVYPKYGIWIKVFSDPKVLISIFITIILIFKSISYESNSHERKKKIE